MSTLTRMVRPASPDQLGLQIATGRVVIAAGMFAAPASVVRLFGADSATAARVTWLARMMAVRDGAIGAGGLLAARRGAGAGPWLFAGAVSDAVDAAVVVTAFRQGRLRGAAPVAVAPVAAALAVVGGYAAVRVRR